MGTIQSSQITARLCQWLLGWLRSDDIMEISRRYHLTCAMMIRWIQQCRYSEDQISSQMEQRIEDTVRTCHLVKRDNERDGLKTQNHLIFSLLVFLIHRRPWSSFGASSRLPKVGCGRDGASHSWRVFCEQGEGHPSPFLLGAFLRAQLPNSRSASRE